MKNRFFKTTLGKNSQVFVTGDLAYTTSATYAAFVTGAPSASDGTYGIFRSDTGALVPNTAGTFATDCIAGIGGTSSIEFFVAQVNGGKIRRSTAFKNSDIISRRFTPYTMPQRQITYLGWNGATGAFNAGTIVANMQFSFTTIETTPDNEPAVRNVISTVTGIAATQNEVTYNAVKFLLDDLNNVNGAAVASKYQNPNVVYGDAVYGGNATLTPFTGTGSMVLTKGSATITITGGTQTNGVAGDWILINSQSNQTVAGFNTATAEVFNSNNILYKVTAATTTTITLDRPYTGETQTIAVGNWVTATQWVKRITAANFTTGTNIIGIRFVAQEFFTTYRIGVQESLLYADITYATPYALGNGIAPFVQYIEQQGYVFGGVATYNNAFAADFGQPNYITNLNRAYGVVDITLRKTVESHSAPKASDTDYSYIYLVGVYVTGSNNPAAAADAESFATVVANLAAAVPVVNTAAANVPVPVFPTAVATPTSALDSMVSIVRPSAA